jgi:hypothetical protein
MRFEALEGRLTLSAIPGVPCPAAVAAAASHQVSAAVVAKPVTNATTKAVVKAPVTNTSSNWSGYAVTGAAGSVSYVAGTWTVPTVSTKTSGYSAVWVGIDGYNSSSVEQLGTGEDVSGGRATYYAWYEMYPAGSVTISSMTVKPGDVMTASVTYDPVAKDFVLAMTDVTQSENFSITMAAPNAARSSAEWVVEAPSSGSGILPLANYGTVTFSNAYASIAGTTAQIDNWQSYAINMTSRGTVVSTTGGLADSTATSGLPTGSSSTYSGTVSGFSVSYGVTTPVTPTPTPPTPTPTPPAPRSHHGWGGWGWGGWGGWSSWGWSSWGWGW